MRSARHGGVRTSTGARIPNRQAVAGDQRLVLPGTSAIVGESGSYSCREFTKGTGRCELKPSHSLSVAAFILFVAIVGCHRDAAKEAGGSGDSSAEQVETRIVGAVQAPTKTGKTVTAGIHASIISARRAPPTEDVIRAILAAAQQMIRDSVTSPTTFAAAIAAGRDVPVLTRYATLANPVPSYTISRARFTWITAGDKVNLTNDQCLDSRQRFIAFPGERGAYICAPTTLGWNRQPVE